MNWRCLIFVFIAIATGFFSCKNNDNLITPVTYTDLTLVNATTDTLNFYLNGTRQNNFSSLFPGGVLTHLQPPSGSQNYQFKKAGNSAVLFSVPLKLTAATYYSLYLTGESADKAFNHPDTLYTDTLPNIATVRFVHAAPDAGSLDVFVGDTVNFKSRVFKSTSVFLPVGSGQKEIKIYQTGASTPKIDTIIAVQPNQIYTLFAKGQLSGTGNAKFGLGIIVNSQ